MLYLALLITLFAASPARAAGEWWHEIGRGCGTVESWKISKRIADMPGCDGELPSGAPPGETAMHDAKLKLHQAERTLDAGSKSGVPDLLASAADIMNKAPDDPRVNWAKFFFNQAQDMLKERLAAVDKPKAAAPSQK